MEPPSAVLVAGVDEAGRGPLAGPVTAAAVMLGPVQIVGLNDSKKLTAGRRALVEQDIISECMTYSVAHATVAEIEEIGIGEAVFMAMQRAVEGLVIVPDQIMVDGNQLPDLPYPATTVVGGDGLIPEIMAASILAKEARDRIMVDLDREYPRYGFAGHKGYPTKDHLAALAKHGPCRAHRRNFRPVAKLLGE